MLMRMEVANGKTQVNPFVSTRKSPGSLPMGRLKRAAIHKKIPMPIHIHPIAQEDELGLGGVAQSPGAHRPIVWRLDLEVFGR
jgi:hypothetical protein